MHFRTLVQFSGVDERVLLTDEHLTPRAQHNTDDSEERAEGTRSWYNRAHSKSDIVVVPQPSPDPNDPLRWPTWKKHIAFFNVALFSFMVVGFTSGLAPALHVLGLELHATRTELFALVTFVTLLVGVTQFLWVPMALIGGRRPVFVLSSIIFFAGVVGCAVAPDYRVLLGCRLITGVGGGSTEALAAALINDIYFLHERGTMMGLYTFSIYAGTGVMSLINGYMVQTVGWRWFCWLCAIISGVNCVGFFFLFPETAFDRQHVSTDVADGVLVSPGVKPKTSSDHLEHFDDIKLPATVVESLDKTVTRQSYWQQLSLWPRFVKGTPVASIILRPYALFTFPVVLWATVTFALVIAVVIAASTFTSFIFQAPPYNFSPGTNSLINIPAVLGNIVGSFTGGYLSDIWARRWARKHHGVFCAESRLVLLAFPAIVVPVGLLMFGLGAQFHLPWPVLFVGYFLLNTANGSAAITMNYVAETFPTIAFECLLVVNAIKNVICFGLVYGFSPWFASIGYGGVFGTLAALYLALLLAAIPLYVWGEQIKRFSASRMKVILE